LAPGLDGCAYDVLHNEVQVPFAGLAGVEDLGDVRVVHYGERLALVVKTGQRRGRVPGEFHTLRATRRRIVSGCSARYMEAVPTPPKFE
jgi:hypothetical protein